MSEREMRWTATEIAEARGWKPERIYARIREREALGLLLPRGDKYKIRYTYDEALLIVRKLHLKDGRLPMEAGEGMERKARVAMLRQRLDNDGML